MDGAAARRLLAERGRALADVCRGARRRIADVGWRFIRDGATVLVHGYSRTALGVLVAARRRGRRFQAICTEGRPDGTGVRAASELAAAGVPVAICLDAAAATALGSCGLVLVGAEGVVESGGVLNKLGTYGVALLARQLNVPVYVAAESYKFCRLYPLRGGAGDACVPAEARPVDFGPLCPAEARTSAATRDYTPPRCVSLLFTDLGVLTPAAVSDELIQLYL